MQWFFSNPKLPRINSTVLIVENLKLLNVLSVSHKLNSEDDFLYHYLFLSKHLKRQSVKTRLKGFLTLIGCKTVPKNRQQVLKIDTDYSIREKYLWINYTSHRSDAIILLAKMIAYLKRG